MAKFAVGDAVQYNEGTVTSFGRVENPGKHITKVRLWATLDTKPIKFGSPPILDTDVRGDAGYFITADAERMPD